MNQIFRSHLDKFFTIFGDDILIYSKIRVEKKRQLSTVLLTLRQEKLHAKLSKCNFWLERVACLSHIISKDGFSIDLQNTSNVEMGKWGRPKNVTGVRSFLGLAKYYQNLLKDFIRSLSLDVIDIEKCTLH